jgi:glucan phosphoethanolaminetransferase (alkaline phosphatase superfamily)
MVLIGFGTLFLLDSLFFVVSYATFDFFGARSSPFFAWLRQLSFIMQTLYFPAFCAALVCIEPWGKNKKLKGLIYFCVISQLALGGLLTLFRGAGLYGWALLFGPHTQAVLHYVEPYTQAVVGLIPLAWISTIHIIGAIRRDRHALAPNTLKIGSFMMAGLAVSLLYHFAARMQLAHSKQTLSWYSAGLSVALHVFAFTALFVGLQWIRLAASKFSNPNLVQLALRSVAAGFLLFLLFRKIIFALLSFNNHLANLYAAEFAITMVLFSAALVLRFKERSMLSEGQESVARKQSPAKAAWLLAGAIGFFYLFAIKFAHVDWDHVLSSVTALITSGLLLWFFLAVPHRERTRNYGVKFLLPLSVLVIAGLAGLRALALRENVAAQLDEYSNYHPSFFALQQVLKPSVEDEEHAAWYRFLTEHANIRRPVEVPFLALAENLTPTTLEKPNIFVFVIDALRRDYVSAYNPAVTFTPAVGSFAQESVVFQHAYSTYAGTELAVPAIWSGMQQVSKTFPEPIARLNHLQAMLNVDGYDCYTSFNPVVAAMAGKSDRITNLSAQLVGDRQQDFQAIIGKLEEAILKRKIGDQPVFVYSQPANVHTLSLTWHRGEMPVTPHPGFDDAYASGVERVDASFGEFIAFLKKHGLYEKSIVILTADHGESLGEMGRYSHVDYLTPEIIEIPMIIHVPAQGKSDLVWATDQLVTLHDITPTLYYLLGHRPLNRSEMIGHPLFTSRQDAVEPGHPDHLLLMSSYLPVFGVLSGDGRSLFYVNAVLGRSFYYELRDDPQALKSRITLPIRDHHEAIIRQELETIDRFYGLAEQQLTQAQPQER